MWELFLSIPFTAALPNIWYKYQTSRWAMKPEEMFWRIRVKGQTWHDQQTTFPEGKKEKSLYFLAIIHYYKLNFWIQKFMCKASQDAAHEDSLELTEPESRQRTTVGLFSMLWALHNSHLCYFIALIVIYPDRNEHTCLAFWLTLYVSGSLVGKPQQQSWCLFSPDFWKTRWKETSARTTTHSHRSALPKTNFPCVSNWISYS